MWFSLFFVKCFSIIYSIILAFYSIILCFVDTVKFYLLILVLLSFQFLLFFLKTLQEMDFHG